MKKRLVCWLTILLMLVALVPSSVLAEGEGTNQGTKTTFETSKGTISEPEAEAYTFSNWVNNGSGWVEETTKVSLYTLTVPAGTESVTLTFPEDRLAYAYNQAGTYLAGYGSNADGSYPNYGQTGAETATVTTIDGAWPDYVRIQTPYDSSWTSTTLYAISIVYENGRPSSDQTKDDVDASVTEIYEKIGDVQKNDVDTNPTSIKWNQTAGLWELFGLARAGRDLSKEAVVSLVSSINEQGGKLNTSRYDYSNYARAILVLTAAGYDAGTVCDTNLLAEISTLEHVTDQGINGAIWALLAADSADYEFTEPESGKEQTTRDALVAYILNAQLSDGGWNYLYTGSSEENEEDPDSDVDMTAMAITALAPYYYGDDADIRVKKAVNAALAFLADSECSDGTFPSDGTTEGTAESTAWVIVALTSLGINPATDERFVRNMDTADGGKKSVSPIDGICSFYTESSQAGFRHVAGGARNVMATYEGYYGLAAYYRYLENETPLFDMTDVKLAVAIDAGDSTDGQNGADPTGTVVPVKGGDEAMLPVWFGLFVASAAVLAFSSSHRKRANR